MEQIILIVHVLAALGIVGLILLRCRRSRYDLFRIRDMVSVLGSGHTVLEGSVIALGRRILCLLLRRCALAVRRMRTLRQRLITS